jgi:hypothetical protein
MFEYITSKGWTVEMNPGEITLFHKASDRIKQFRGRTPIIAAYAFVIKDSGVNRG